MADASGNQNLQETTPMSDAQKKLQRAIYFFRTGDLTVWNYVILALSILGLCLGLFLLSKNILNNRKRKYQMNMAAKPQDDSDGKQAVLTLEKDNPPQEDYLLKKEIQTGDITVQWKDGQISSLYTNLPEEDV
ncbi:organic solute transporter subunit beta-like [Pseudophryne corroboree]|uniref:organic solute transporter subunit beta-like n=1 Tax=Pseudophryne corroboree TaxID=495146 RepID=UPI003081BBAB